VVETYRARGATAWSLFLGVVLAIWLFGSLLSLLYAYAGRWLY